MQGTYDFDSVTKDNKAVEIRYEQYTSEKKRTENLTLTFSSTQFWQNMCLQRSKIHFFSRVLQTGQVILSERYLTCVVSCSTENSDPTPLDEEVAVTDFFAACTVSFFITARDSIICFFSSSFFVDSATRSLQRLRAASRSFVTAATFSFAWDNRPLACSVSWRRELHFSCSFLIDSSMSYGINVKFRIR